MVDPVARNPVLSVKPEPFTVRVKDELPAGMEEGLRLLIAGPGAGAVIEKSTPLIAVPPVLTDTVALPCEVIRAAAIGAFNWLALTKVVNNGVPFHRTAELVGEANPFTVRVKAGPPACAVDGLIPLMVGICRRGGDGEC